MGTTVPILMTSHLTLNNIIKDYMHCARLDHFVKILSSDPRIARCCHQIGAPAFLTLAEMESSEWLVTKKSEMSVGVWPSECVRCMQSEQIGLQSVRQQSNDQDAELAKLHPNYLTVDIIVNSVCNAACSTCGPNQSSTWAKIRHKIANLTNSIDTLYSFAQDRVVSIDILGGEPAVSPESRNLILRASTDFNLVKLQINTNGSAKIREIEKLLCANIPTTIVLSMDGTRDVFEYARWPIKWDKFVANAKYYKSLSNQYPHLTLSLWTSHSAVSIGDYHNMEQFSSDIGVPLSGALISTPVELSINRNNFLTRAAKHMLESSSSKSALKLSALVSTDIDDNSPQIKHLLDWQDRLRGTNHITSLCKYL